MENQVNSKSIIINFGLILAGFSIFINLVNYAIGNHLDPHWSITVISILALVALIVFGIKKYKEANNGFLSWGQAVKIGVGIAIISALIGSLYNYVFMNFIEPDFMQQMAEIQNQKMLDQGYTDEQIEAANEMSESFRNPALIAAFGIIGSAIGGFIVSAIAGAIMKKSEEDDF